METTIKNVQVNFKTNSEILSKAKAVFASKNLDMTSSLNLFLANVAQTQELPFMTVEDEERECLIHRLQDEVNQNLTDIQAGQGISLSEARKRFSL